MSNAPIIFVHGMYMTSLCWTDWVKRFEQSGYKSIAPNWPGRDRNVDDLRRMHPDENLGRLTLSMVVEHFVKIIKALKPKPIAVGHSMGGLVVQLLMQMDLLAAGVAIDSAPPAGVFVASWSFLRSNWPHAAPGGAIAMSFKRFQYTFVNGLPIEEQKDAFNRYVVPESRRVPRESLRARIDFRKSHLPLLLIAGSSDHIVPARLNWANYAKYQRGSSSVVDYKEFKGRTHFIIGQQNWEQVANYVLGWIKEKGL